MPEDFPYHYPLNKDIDILCLESDYSSLINSVITNTKKYSRELNIKIVQKQEYRIQIRIELENYLLFLFDVFSFVEKTKNNFIEAIVNKRKGKDCFYIPSEDLEYLIRLVEVSEHPNKEHHKKYLKEHIHDFDSKLCERFLDFVWQKCIEA
jgi:hypothetical protein